MRRRGREKGGKLKKRRALEGEEDEDGKEKRLKRR